MLQDLEPLPQTFAISNAPEGIMLRSDEKDEIGDIGGNKGWGESRQAP